jgi:hypothetical protein
MHSNSLLESKPRKSYETYKFCIALPCQSRQRALRWLRASRQSTSRLERERQKIYAVFCSDFSFFEIGSGANPHHPPVGGGGCRSESLPAFKGARNPSNGTREFATGTRNRASGIQLPPGNHSVSGLSCFWRRRYCSRQTTLGDRNQRYSPFQGWEVYLARSSWGIVHSRRKESSRF